MMPEAGRGGGERRFPFPAAGAAGIGRDAAPPLRAGSVLILWAARRRQGAIHRLFNSFAL